MCSLVAYVGIRRVCTGGLAIISGVVRRIIIGGIRAVLLSSLHNESAVAPSLPRRVIIKAQCVAAAVTKEVGKEQLIVTLIDHGGCRHSTAATGPHSRQQSIQKSTKYHAMGISH